MKRKILIIDDEQETCWLMERHLCAVNFEVSVAFDGEDGLSKAKLSHPDLIILDLKLPKLSGEEVCRELKKDPGCCQIPVIIVSGKDAEADRVIGRVIGAEYYITKPFDTDLLDEKIKSCLERRLRESK